MDMVVACKSSTGSLSAGGVLSFYLKVDSRTALAVGAEPCGGVVKGPAMVIVMMWMNVIIMRFNGSGNLNRQ